MIHNLRLIGTALSCLISVRVSAFAQRTVNSIAPPDGFTRIDADGFGRNLRDHPLKAEGGKVHLYDGTEKYWQGGAYAVVDLEIGSTDLQQCADACMRLRVKYLWKNKSYSDIHFNFTNGFNAEYSKWAEGYRIRVEGNKVSWYRAGNPDYTYRSFRKYLNMVFSYAGTASLSDEMASIALSDVQIGDIFIRGGHPVTQ